MNHSPKYRRPLNQNQLTTLLFTFKFRFITAQLLSSAFGNKSRRSTQQTLQILEEQGYIAKRYEPSYRLQGRQATYYLLPKAVHEIHTRYTLSQSVLKTYLRNSSVSDTFINHHLDILKAYISLKTIYSNQFNLFTKYELADFDYFPNPKPDIYLSRVKTSSTNPNEYLLDIYSNTPLFVIRRRVASVIFHFENNQWEDQTSSTNPIILIACPDSKTEAKAQSFALNKLDSSEATSLSIYTTTTNALFSNGPDTDIWSNIEDQYKLLNL